jgi:GNAT superfamily N-acetyltransferase
VIRRATIADRPAILDLMVASLGWQRDRRHEEMFAWKHDDNPFGPSPAWVAVEDDRVLGLRTFMRWAFEDGDERRRAVRAVDTATHPDAQGKGLFRTLTMTALEELTAEGVDWVFNTPNDKSRPGYLKMGWSEVGHLALSFRPGLSLRGFRESIVNRAAHAELWPVDVGGARSIRDFLDGAAGEVTDLLDHAASAGGVLRTARSVGYLRWRYGFDALNYGVIGHPKGASRGFAIYRVRRRGSARELSLCEVMTRPGDQASMRELVREAVKVAGPDFTVALGDRLPGMVGLGARGPVLTARTAATVPPAGIASWQLSLGDVELF